MAVSLEQVQAVLSSHRNWLLKQPEVQGSTDGYDSNGLACAIVWCGKPSEATKEAIRQRLGVPVKFEEDFKVRLE